MHATDDRRRRPLPRTGAKIARYLVSEMVPPSIYAVVAFGLVVLMTDLLGYTDLIVNRGLDAGEVAQIAGLQLVPTLARTLPFAVLVDPHGTVRHVHAGYRAEDAMAFGDELAALILE